MRTKPRIYSLLTLGFLPQLRSKISSSETVVCFGIVMRSWQLIVAAQAFVKFSPRLRGIDIIIARQRKGTLLVEEEVEKSTNVTDMPLEVLEEIRSKVFSKRELGSAARQLVQVPGGGSNGWKKMPRPHDDDDWALDHYNECVSEVRFGHRSIDNPVVSFAPSVSLYHSRAYQCPRRLRSWSTTDWNWLPTGWGIKKIGKSKTAQRVSSPSRCRSRDSKSMWNSKERLKQTFSSYPLWPTSTLLSIFVDCIATSRLYRDFQFDVVSDFSSTPPIPTVTSVAASATATVVNDKTSTEGGGSKLGDSDILGSLKPRWTVWMSVDPAY